jgi:hypothetical protein
MGRKFAIAVILLLLVVVQAAALDCALNCTAMNLMARSSNSHSMQNCPGMHGETVSNSCEAMMVRASQSCSWKLCMLEVVLPQSQTEHEAVLVKGSFIGAIIKNVLADAVLTGLPQTRLAVSRRAEPIPLDLLISTLRI